MTSTTEASVKHDYDRIPYLIAYQNTSAVRDVYGGGAYLPMINGLAQAGHHVLAELKVAGRPEDEFAFVVHGTMADPRWLDPTVDPNDRTSGTCYLGDPRVVNSSPVGLARVCTLRSWLSQWSYDDACTPSHTRRSFEAIGHPDKEMREIAGANHYYAGSGQRGTLREAVGMITDWLHRHGLSL